MHNSKYMIEAKADISEAEPLTIILNLPSLNMAKLIADGIQSGLGENSEVKLFKLQNK